jgi:exodeoxyribonuclease VII large subunit
VTEVVGALQRLDADRAVDVIIVARGGGSLEDLLPFSDETLVREVAACRTPVVSAIGHEQDTPLLDLVADVRASTPTDAARRVVPDVTEQLSIIAQLRSRSRRIVEGRLDRERAWLDGMRSRPVLADPVREIDRRQEQVTALTERSRRCLATALSRAGDDISHLRARLLALAPSATLERGYAIVQRADGGVVRGAAEVAAREKLTLRFASDQLWVRADKPPREPEPEGAVAASAEARPASPPAARPASPAAARRAKKPPASKPAGEGDRTPAG